MFTNLWQSLMYESVEEEAREDQTVAGVRDDDDVVELESQSCAIDMVARNAPRRPRSVLYRREMTLNCALANDEHKDTASTRSSLTRALADDDDDNAAAARERSWSSKIDEQISLADLVHSSNRLGRESLHASDDSVGSGGVVVGDDDHVMLVELAIVVLDEQWDPEHMYLLVEAERVGPLQRTQMCIGNRDAVLRTTSTSNALDFERRDRLRGRLCALSSEARVDGWCKRCGLQPSMVTIYQSPLGDKDLLHYAAELCSQTGTHGNVARFDAERNVLEIAGESTLLDDIRQSEPASVVDECYNDGVGEAYESGVAFVDADVWQRELAARRYVLNNLPLVNPAEAKIRVAARIAPSVHGAAEKTLRLVLTAQCIEFAR